MEKNEFYDQKCEEINYNEIEVENSDYFGENRQNEFHITRKVKQSLFDQKLTVKEIKNEIGKFLKQFVNNF